MAPHDAERNSFGPHFQFKYDPLMEHTFPSTLPGVFPDITHCNTRMEPFEIPSLSPHLYRKQLIPGALTGAAALPGFPTLQTLKFHIEFRHDAQINLFGAPAKSVHV